MEVNSVKYHFLIPLFKYGIDMIEGAQCGKDWGSETGARGRVVSCDNDRLDLSNAKTFELAEAKTDGTVGGVRAMEEVACVDDIIGFNLDYVINYLGKGIVKIGFTLIDTKIIDNLKIVKS